jgi:hypothetical protein
MFLFRLFSLVGELTGVELFAFFETFALPVYALVFIIALFADPTGKSSG